MLSKAQINRSYLASIPNGPRFRFRKQVRLAFTLDRTELSPQVGDFIYSRRFLITKKADLYYGVTGDDVQLGEIIE